MTHGAIGYRRVLLKLSGELIGSAKNIFDFDAVEPMAEQIQRLLAEGIQIAVVLGGGNIYRGRLSHVSAETGDHIGMLATIINGLALRDFLERKSIRCLLQSALPSGTFAERHNSRMARHALEEGQVVIFSGGTGLPFFSTDMAAAHRAIEVGADVLLKATKVDGIYDSDPMQNTNAVHFPRISFDEVVRRGLNVMDQEAFCLCRRYRMPIIVFSMHRKNALIHAAGGKPMGSFIGESF
ncbi:MAG: UMP kinase [Puniceicoccales bacterium]|jgi:uridylate kinase|nr:UMP kinase [Puniceicoccales bacterium]